MADEETRREEVGVEGAEAAYRRILARKLAKRGLSGTGLEREVKRLLGKAKTMRLADESRMSRRP